MELKDRLFRQIIILCLTVVVVVRIGIPCAKRLVVRAQLIEQNIYEVITQKTISSSGQAELCAYYMICKPEETSSELQRQILCYLDESNLVFSLAKKYKDYASSVVVYFVQPTKSWPIGRFPSNDDGDYQLYTDMCLAAVYFHPDRPEDFAVNIVNLP